jgi:hypothetical protein
MADLRPGTLALVEDDPELLARAIEEAWRDPASTRLAPQTQLAPTLDSAARDLAGWWERVSW